VLIIYVCMNIQFYYKQKKYQSSHWTFIEQLHVADEIYLVDQKIQFYCPAYSKQL